MQYLGIDWAYRRAAWCALSEGGAIVGEGAVPAEEDGLARLVLRLGPDVRAVVEIMSGAIWVIERQPRHDRGRAGAHRSGQQAHQGPHGEIAMARTLRHRVTSEARASDQELGPTITAVLDDGPLRGIRIEAQVVEGRPPSTVNVPADDGSTCRYCLAEWVQSGPSAVYTFLYRV